MKNKTCIQLKKISKVFYGIFITIAVAVLAIFVLDAIQSFDGGRVQDGIGSLLLGLLIGAVLYFIGLMGYILLKGYILFIENSCRLVNEAKVSEKNQNEVKELLETISHKLDVQETVPVKEDLSHIKKSTKQTKVTAEEKELLNEAKASKETKKPAGKTNSPENIKEKLARAKGEVQKTMAVRSQVAANTISSGMLDDISDKNSIVEFETPEVYSQIEAELFKDCINLEKVEITNNIKLIGANAFNGCDALQTVIIGKGVGVIEKSAFEGCTGLDKVIYKGNKKSWDEIVVQSGNDILKRVDITFEEE